MMTSVILLGASLVAPVPPAGHSAKFYDSIECVRQVRLSNVADLSGLPQALQSRASSLILSTVANCSAARLLDVQELASRARAMLPALGPWMVGPYAGKLILESRKQASAAMILDGDAGGVQKGKAVSIGWKFGIFSISREGRALSSAKPGERLFVLTRNGVVAAQCCGAQ